MGREAWWATDHGVAESDMTEWPSTVQHRPSWMSYLPLNHHWVGRNRELWWARPALQVHDSEWGRKRRISIRIRGNRKACLYSRKTTATPAPAVASWSPEVLSLSKTAIASCPLPLAHMHKYEPLTSSEEDIGGPRISWQVKQPCQNQSISVNPARAFQGQEGKRQCTVSEFPTYEWVPFWEQVQMSSLFISPTKLAYVPK